MSFPFNQFKPFSEHSDRRAQVGMRISGEWLEETTGIKHFIKTNELTGEQWNCMTDPSGKLLAEYTMRRGFPRLTLIRRRARDGRELGRETYGLKRGTEIPASTKYSDLKNLVESGVKSGTIHLTSGSDETIENEDGTITVRVWEYVWLEGGVPGGKKYSHEVYSKEGGLISTIVGDRQTSYDPSGPMAAPLGTTDTRTGQRIETMSDDLLLQSNARIQREVRIVDEGKPTPAWKQIVSRLLDRSK